MVNIIVLTKTKLNSTFSDNQFSWRVFESRIVLKEIQKLPSRGVLTKGVLKISSRFTGEHRCLSAISIKLQSNFIEITLWHGSSPVNLLPISRIPFPKNTYGRLLLEMESKRLQVEAIFIELSLRESKWFIKEYMRQSI